MDGRDKNDSWCTWPWDWTSVWYCRAHEVHSEHALDVKKRLPHTSGLIFLNDFNRVCVSVAKVSFVFYTETDAICGLPIYRWIIYILLQKWKYPQTFRIWKDLTISTLALPKKLLRKNLATRNCKTLTPLSQFPFQIKICYQIGIGTQKVNVYGYCIENTFHSIKYSLHNILFM